MARRSAEIKIAKLFKRKLVPLREIRRWLKRTEPFLSSFTEAALECLMDPADSPTHMVGIEDPAIFPVVVIPVTTNRFNACAEYRPARLTGQDGRTLNAETAWNAGMQAYVVHTVYILVDQEDRTLVMYHLMNDRDGVTILGSLTPGHRFTKLVLERARQFVENGELYHKFYSPSGA